MENQEQKLVFSALSAGQHFLIAVQPFANGDGLGSALALARYLRKRGKHVDVVSSGDVRPYLQSLPEITSITKDIPAQSSLVRIDIPLSSTSIENLSYETNNDKLSIYFTPTENSFDPKHVSFHHEQAGYDAIVVLAAPSLESLGSAYQNNIGSFYNSPVIAVDTHPSNERYGQINLVDIAATSTAEIIAEMLYGFDPEMIDTDIATALLAGIVDETNSFHDIKTTPKSLKIGSRLITDGARHQEIVRAFYKTRSLSHLRLWGRALARLKQDRRLEIAWSVLTQQDLQKCQATSDEIPRIVHEIHSNVPDANAVFVVVEGQDKTHEVYFYGAGFKKLLELSAFYINTAQLEDVTRFYVKAENVTDAENGFIGNLTKLLA